RRRPARNPWRGAALRAGVRKVNGKKLLITAPDLYLLHAAERFAVAPAGSRAAPTITEGSIMDNESELADAEPPSASATAATLSRPVFPATVKDRERVAPFP